MAAKGKGKPPAAVEIAGVEGAKFASVRAGTSDCIVTMTINLNCPVDIILDNVKRFFIKKLEGHITQLSGATRPVTSATANESAIESENNPISEANQALINKLKEFRQLIQTPDVIIEFSDAGGSITTCKDNLKKNGSDGVLAHGVNYNLICQLSGSQSAPVVCYVDNSSPPPDAGAAKTPKKK